jgi:thioredoxin reductase (NADPH)
MPETIYDTIIIGAGPAALSASVYASRYFLSHLLIGDSLGGTMAYAHKVENYPGIKSISGLELASKMEEQIKSFGAPLIFGEVKGIKKSENCFLVTAANSSGKNKVYSAKSLIIATGMRRRLLGVPGEKELSGRGVSYCSTCDAAFFKNKKVVVIGGSNAATMAAVHLAEYADQVFLMYRGEKLKGEPAWNKKALDDKKVTVLFNMEITKIWGESKVEKVTLSNPYNNSTELLVDGVFIEVGFTPTSAIALELGIELDSGGFIKVDAAGKTNVPGILAAGDITNGSNGFRQIVTAISEGAIAVKTVFDLKSKKEIDYF